MSRDVWRSVQLEFQVCLMQVSIRGHRGADKDAACSYLECECGMFWVVSLECGCEIFLGLKRSCGCRPYWLGPWAGLAHDGWLSTRRMVKYQRPLACRDYHEPADGWLSTRRMVKYTTDGWVHNGWLRTQRKVKDTIDQDPKYVFHFPNV